MCDAVHCRPCLSPKLNFSLDVLGMTEWIRKKDWQSTRIMWRERNIQERRKGKSRIEHDNLLLPRRRKFNSGTLTSGTAGIDVVSTDTIISHPFPPIVIIRLHRHKDSHPSEQMPSMKKNSLTLTAPLLMTTLSMLATWKETMKKLLA